MKAQQLLSVENVKNDFSILTRNKELVYLDNSATSLTPDVVVKEISDYYKNYNANIHRGIYKLSEKATLAYEGAHKKVARFINSDFSETIFTKGTTESLNLLAYSLTKKMKEGEEIVLTEMEHHSNLVPWQQLAKDRKLAIKFIKVNENGRLDLENLKNLITDKTKIVSVTFVSNVLGTINDIKKIAKIVHSKDCLLVVDAAQAVPHFKVNVRELDCDFMAFSGHKMLGPTGIGVLYGKKELLEKMDPFQFGGDMISEVYFLDSKWNELPWKFEAGTPPIASGIGLGKAVDYLNGIGMENIRIYEEFLTEYALEKLKKIEGVKIYRPKETKDCSGVISFNIMGVHPHDAATILDRSDIAVRAGHLCAMPLVREVLGANSVLRVSFYLYNSVEDIDKFINGIHKVKEVFER